MKRYHKFLIIQTQPNVLSAAVFTKFLLFIPCVQIELDPFFLLFLSPFEIPTLDLTRPYPQTTISHFHTKSNVLKVGTCAHNLQVAVGS